MKKTLGTLVLFGALALCGCSDRSEGGMTAGASPSPPGHHATTSLSDQDVAQVQEPLEMTVDNVAHSDAAQRGGHLTMGRQSVMALDKARGQEFEIAFLSQMIAHHKAAVEMAEQSLDVAVQAKTREEARAVISSQKDESARMTKWLQNWYGVGPSATHQKLMRDDMAAMMGTPIRNDRMFYDMMIPHHEGAVEMSRMALAKSERPELKKLADHIERTQSAEIRRYQEQLAALPTP